MTIEIDLKQVEKLAAIGLNERQVADSMGFSQDTMTRRKKDNADFLEALKRGQAKGIAQVANNLFEQSKNGNVSAGIFFMKNRAGWSDKTDIQQAIQGTIDHSIDVKYVDTDSK